jgi:hypothetical protein
MAARAPCQRVASITIEDSGATARIANITPPISAPPVITRASIRYTPHTSITRVMACWLIIDMFIVRLLRRRDRIWLCTRLRPIARSGAGSGPARRSP